MRKSIKALALFLCMMLALSLAACGGGGTSTAGDAPAADGGETGENAGGEGVSGTITFWTQDTATWMGYFEPAIEAFMEEYPDITVNAEYFPEFADKVNQAFSGGQEPDVMQTWQSITDWAKAGKLSPVPDSVFTAEEMESTFYETALKNKQYDGQYYCIPTEINVESPTLFVNMDILEQEGIDLPEGWVENNGPASFDELIEFAKTLTVKDGGLISRSGLAYSYAQFEANFLSLIWQYGGDYRDEANNAVHFETEEARQAAEMILKYTVGDEAVSDPGYSRYDLFVQGTAAMCVGAPWYAGSFAIDNPGMTYQCFNMPAWVEGSDPISQAYGGWGYAVSEKCADKDAAWTFVKWMSSADQTGKWAYETGALPSRGDALADLTYDPEVGSVDKAISITMEVLPFAQEDGAYMLTPSTLTYTIVREQLRNMLDTQDIDAALAAMESGGNQMIEENLAR